MKGVHIYRDGREVCEDNAAGKREYRSRTEQMHDRQGGRCAIGMHPIPVERGSFDHEAGRGGNSGHRDDRLLHEDGTWRNACICIPHNGWKGSRRFHWRDGVYIPARFETLREALLDDSWLPKAYTNGGDAPWL